MKDRQHMIVLLEHLNDDLLNEFIELASEEKSRREKTKTENQNEN